MPSLSQAATNQIKLHPFHWCPSLKKSFYSWQPCQCSEFIWNILDPGDAGDNEVRGCCTAQMFEANNRWKIYAMFVDFSSAFNIKRLHILMERLLQCEVNNWLIRWVESFLTDRSQCIRANAAVYPPIITNIDNGCKIGWEKWSHQKKTEFVN